MAAAAITLGRAGEKLAQVSVLLPPENPTHTAAFLAAPVVSGIAAVDPVGGQESGSSAVSAVGDEGQGPGSEAEPEAVQPVAFLTHEVAEGDSLSLIGAQYGVGVDYLVWNNPEVGTDPDALAIGEELLVPGTDGIVYDVRLGDTISDIAATYSVDPAEIVSFTPNGLESADVIREGMVLVLPGAVPPAPAVEETPGPLPEEAPAPPPNDTPAPPPAPQPPPTVVAAPTVTPTPAPALEPAPPVAGFIWPVNGTLNSRFGPRWGSFHSGIDIGAAWGTAVVATGAGQVVLAVYGDYGYGNYIMVRHGDGSETLYAHLSAIYVSVGQRVAQGEAIGAVGCSGWCTGPHLHFEIRIGGRPVDPLLYLP